MMLWLAASPADCRDAYDRLDFSAAVELCQAALGNASSVEAAELDRILGLSFGALGDEAHAREAFTSLLAMDPHAELSTAVSPRLRSIFLAVKQEGAGVAVQLSAQVSGVPRVGQPLRLGATVSDGPLHPVARLQVEEPGHRASARRADPTTTLELPAPVNPGRVVLSLSALDGLGGPLGTAMIPVEIEQRVPARPWLLSWKVWGAGALVSAAAGLGFGIASRLDTLAAQAEPVAAPASLDWVRARNTAYAADSAYALAGTLAIGTVVLFLTRPEGTP